MKEIMRAIGYISHVHRRMANELLEQQGVSLGQPPVLRYLNEHDGCIQRDLAENCHVKAATISSVLDNMEACGYIERRMTPEDRRVQRIFLTEKGGLKYELTNRVFSELDGKCFEGISEDEMRALMATLQKMVDNLREMSGEREEGK